MSSIPFLVTGFSIGLAGSLHCVGMCGPLALALPVQGFTAGKRVAAVALYNTGRLLSYTILGGLAGIMGRQFFVAGYQQLFSILVGTALLAWLWFSFVKKRPGARSALYVKVQAVIIRNIHKPSLRNIFVTGMGNGLLPCGMVYLGIAAAAASGNVLQAGAFMASFGLGTIPLMGMVSLMGLYIRPSVRVKLKKASPYLTAFIGILLILRGLNLDIPYISPLLNPAGKEVISCH